MNLQLMKLALFDFDGTITTKDSFLHFLWYVDKFRFIQTCLIYFPKIVLYKVGKFPNQQLKELFLEKLLGGMSQDELDVLADAYCREIIPGMIRYQFWQQLAFHQNNGDTVAVVTASPTFMLSAWCREQRIDLIGTRIEIDKRGRVTGKLMGRNCMGEEKVRRIKMRYDIESYEELYAYGDTESDHPMLALAPAANRFYKPFR